MVFTVGDQTYADAVIDEIDVRGLVYDRLYRQHLSWEGDFAYKDVSRYIRDLAHCLIVDDKREFVKQKQNMIKVPPFFGERDGDRFLEQLGEFLESSLGKEDVDLRDVAREYNQRFCDIVDESHNSIFVVHH